MNWFKRSMLVGALAASMAFTGCQPPTQASARASGSVALLGDDSAVYAVDTDNNELLVFDAKTQTLSQRIAVGTAPSRVIVAADDTAFITNRGSRSVSVVRRGDTTEATRIAVGVEPTAMTLTQDGKTLLVVSATALDKTETGLLTAIDVGTLEKKWEIEVGEEPRSVAVVKGEQALVGLYKTGQLVQVDVGTGTIVPNDTQAIYSAANATRLAPGSTLGAGTSSFRPRAMTDLVATPEGDRVFVPVTWAREDNISRRPTTAGGYYAAGGPCNIGAVATAGIVTVDTTNPNQPSPQVDDLTACSAGGTTSDAKDFPVTTLASAAADAAPLQGPTVAALDPSGAWLVVVNRETRNMAWMPAWSRSGTAIDVNSTGSSIRSVQNFDAHGVDGIALAKTGGTAYVYSQFDHQLIVFGGDGHDNASKITKKAVIQVEDRSEFGKNPTLVAGRKLFFDANNSMVSSKQTNVACSTCHLEGREDGHVWQFPDGARQTPALAGRKLLSTAPYHWSGEFATLNQFNVHTITERMGGSGLDPTSADALDTFIDQLPLAENPLRTSMPTDVAQRGRAAFEKAGCDSCHAGSLLTNNTNADVGTLRRVGSNPDNGVVSTNGFNVPSLLGIGRTAPYLHDGSQMSLAERVLVSDGKHGDTAKLGDQEKKDLIVYLKSL